MTPEATFAASVLDATQSSLASGVALHLREHGFASGVPFQGLVADLRVRLQYLAEAVALERAGVYLQHVEWLRQAPGPRGLAPDSFAATHAALRAVLGEELPRPALECVEPVLAEEERVLRQPPREAPSALLGPHGERVARLLEHVLAGRRDAALREAMAQIASVGEESFVTDVLVDVQRELGRLWQYGEIHAGDEHLGSRITEEILARLAPPPAPGPDAPRVVIAATAGDLHDIGARMVARRLERLGCELLFLGADMPAADLLDSLRELQPRFLGLSVSLGLHLRGAAAIVAAAKSLSPAVPVLVGGAPFRYVPDLWRVIGADAQAEDAGEAERVARAWLAL